MGFSGALVRKTDRDISLEVISRLFPCLTDLAFVTQNRVSLTLLSQFAQLTRLVLRDQQSGPPSLRAENLANWDSLPSTLQALELAGISLDRAKSQDVNFTSLTSLKWMWEENTAPDDVWKLLQKLPVLKVSPYCHHLQCWLFTKTSFTDAVRASKVRKFSISDFPESVFLFQEVHLGPENRSTTSSLTGGFSSTFGR